MDKITVKAYAKINLTLDVTGKRADGYHNVKMIMQSCDLHDEVTVEKCESGITLSVSTNELPTDERNIAFRAAEKFFEYTKICGGANIHIEKNIPISAGLAGGSTNAAAVLKALNTLYGAALSEEELEKTGVSLGADVPYCIRGGTCLAEGIGEMLTNLPPFPKTVIAIIKPPVSVSTADIYRRIDECEITKRPDSDKMIEAIKTGDVRSAAKYVENVMQPVTASAHTEIGKIISHIKKYSPYAVCMSGSGPSVFALFESEEAAKAATDGLCENNFVYIGHTI